MGYRIKEAREAQRMTQEELSARSGVSRTIIVALERNEEHNTTTKTLLRIASALGTTVDALFFGEDV